MPNRNEILNELNRDKKGSQDKIRRRYLKNLHNYTKNDTIIYFANFSPKIPNLNSSAISINLDDMSGFMTSLSKLHEDTLDLIIHSPGGQAEATIQIVQYLRKKYKTIRAIIPQNAMSAATMLACACDEIIMGKESAIGPIDPQIAIPFQGSIMNMPAHSILRDFESAKNDVSNNPQLSNIWAPKLMQIPFGIFDFCTKSIDAAKTNVAAWLDMYMFKDDDLKKGEKIAEFLGNFDLHGSHGKPFDYLKAKEIGLKVKLLEDDQLLQEKVLSLYHACLLTFDFTNCVKIIENHNGVGSFMQIQIPIHN